MGGAGAARAARGGPGWVRPAHAPLPRAGRAPIEPPNSSSSHPLKHPSPCHAANLVYRCALAPRGVEESVVLARIHANRGGSGDGCGGDHAHGAAALADSAAAPPPPPLPAGAKAALNSDAAHAAGDGVDDGEGGGVSLFDRKEEIATFSAVSSAGLGPQLLLLFKNGRLEEFLVE